MGCDIGGDDGQLGAKVESMLQLKFPESPEMCTMFEIEGIMEFV